MKLKKLDIHFIISLLVVNLFSICGFWSLSYIDYTNMVNNGFINEQAISFTVNNTKKPLIARVNYDKYILLQYRPEIKNVKHVLLSGNVQLPPIEYIDDINLELYENDVAIIGKNANVNNVPINYKLAGYFKSSNSYLLDTEVWLISRKSNIDYKFGTSFTFLTPEQKTESVLYRNLDLDTIHVTHSDYYGSYSIKSNKVLILSLKLALFFMTVIFLILSTNWLLRDKNLIRILYLSGMTTSTIFFNISKYKAFSYLLFSMSLIISMFIYQNYFYSMWSSAWILYSTYLLIGLNLYLFGLCVTLVVYYTKGKGGKNF